MKIVHAFLPCLILMSGCAEGTRTAEADFTVSSSRNRDLVPENVILDVVSRSEFPLCLAIAETRVGSGNIDLIPDSGESLGSRSPQIIMSGLDVSEGIYVILPNKDLRIFVNIGSIGSKSRILKGTIRAAACREIFSKGTAKIVQRSFSQKL